MLSQFIFLSLHDIVTIQYVQTMWIMTPEDFKITIGFNSVSMAVKLHSTTHSLKWLIMFLFLFDLQCGSCLIDQSDSHHFWNMGESYISQSALTAFLTAWSWTSLCMQWCFVFMLRVKRESDTEPNVFLKYSWIKAHFSCRVMCM